MIFTFSCSLGEASNPGPDQGNLLLGAANPTGLLGKGHVFASLPRAHHTIWAVSETHLTVPGAAKFSQELKIHKTGFQAQIGKKVPAKSQAITAIGEKQSGVGFITDRPNRPLHPTWTNDQADPQIQGIDQCRLHSACYVGAVK